MLKKKKVKDLKCSFSVNLVINNPLNQCMIIDPVAERRKPVIFQLMSLDGN